MSDNWLGNAASSPYLPIVAGLVRGVVGIAAGLGAGWAQFVTGDQITTAAMAAVALGMLVWSVWQKIAAVREKRAAEVAAAVASAKLTYENARPMPVTVTVTPAGEPNIATRINATEMAAAPAVPMDVAPAPAPRPAA